MELSDLHFELPPERIAQHPAPERDQSRLLVLDRASGEIEFRRFFELPELLDPRDCLVVNNTKVIPARFEGRRATGGKVDGLFVGELLAGTWEVLLRSGGRLARDERIELSDERSGLILMEPGDRGLWRACVDPPQSAADWLAANGSIPLPPYIRREGGAEHDDRERYQTRFAREAGAVAAPTAGLHFTPQIFAALRARGLDIAEATLHIGIGTFRPIEAERIEDHRMHAEWFRLNPKAVEAINQRRAAGGRAVAVGTSTVRTLESRYIDKRLTAGEGTTDLFIFPPYRFGAVDAMITNFHLPGSTLLAMVQAFAGTEATMRSYEAAIRKGFRFYSYGDAMLIL
jgi:S-adenosylmethionine:tRNA ribosyltransferase-isomerase